MMRLGYNAKPIACMCSRSLSLWGRNIKPIRNYDHALVARLTLFFLTKKKNLLLRSRSLRDHPNLLEYHSLRLPVHQDVGQ